MTHEPMFRLLEAGEIEVRLKTASENGAVALLYKTARTDMDILDSTVGAMNWGCDYREIKGNLYCTITINGIRKENCGIESREDDEGNEKKGEASDAFKRAGFVWGIGRELYTAPFIFLNIPTQKDAKSGKYRVTGFPSYSVAEIGYDDKRRINRLKIRDDKTGKIVYTYPKTFGDEREPDEAQAEAAQGAESVRKAEADKRVEIVRLGEASGRDEDKVRAFCEAFAKRKYKTSYTFDNMPLGVLVACQIELNKRIEAEQSELKNE